MPPDYVENHVSESTPIYLDHNATTPISPAVADAVREASVRYEANPASQHAAGRKARRALEAARVRVGELLGARTVGMDADRVIFTSGGTEAANLAVFGLAGASSPEETVGHFVTSAIEHPCVLEAVDQLPNFQIERLPATIDGQVQVDWLQSALQPNTCGVSVMLANNETGVVQPIEEMAALCSEHGTPMHSDATQAIGKIPVSFSDLGVSLMSLAAHKFHGPLGVGALLIRHSTAIKPSLFGGHQQAGLRPGTESVALAIGLQVALEHCLQSLDEESARLAGLRDQFERTLAAELPELEIIGRNAQRLPNTANLGFRGWNRQALLMALDQAGIACSSGSACASGSSEPSPTLLAMGLKNEVIEGSVRFSMGRSTTTAEVEEACRRILFSCKRLR